ncbi:transcriptional regulator, ArsR family [Anaerobranca californiensis DSM 14826]|jgi:ArsR family transcriptional regulator|uniref:Transcriptional regulator, ArsR family n=1 Tax=Anaerobranca californiensis DSM 14826 TaxID=1120989 RepID=A0A1M6NYS2_9FIRM|nr:metalloregulator ArsR/SmtB family transcription factor [Anaerobranca californiensis]SHK00836.1 transcriptional regulator, ArsR family [Anaerobranca californiensis DSM 14826]
MELLQIQVKFFKALAHPIRLKILEKLAKGPLCVCELNEDIEFSQGNLSQHLKILKDAYIIDNRKEGLKVFYFIRDEKVLAVMGESKDIIKSFYENISKA